MALFFVANWKMNGSAQSVRTFCLDLDRRLRRNKPQKTVIFCPPFPYLAASHDFLHERSSPLLLGGQDCHSSAVGAHTGDVSASILKDVGCTFVILGHGERRRDHKETNVVVAEKVKQALEIGLTPIVCVGERERTPSFLDDLAEQLKTSIPWGSLGPQDKTSLLVAYEPLWAIGGPTPPTRSQIEEVHDKMAEVCLALGVAPPILYGGAVQRHNIHDILSIEKVSGVMVGGASLSPSSFWEIVDA